MTNPYIVINNFGDQSLIGGTRFIFEFDIYEKETKLPYDLTDTLSIAFLVRSFGNDDEIALINKTASVVAINTCQVVLETNDTVNLSGKYVYQLVITDVDGYIYKPGQGFLTIIKAIKTS